MLSDERLRYLAKHPVHFTPHEVGELARELLELRAYQALIKASGVVALERARCADIADSHATIEGIAQAIAAKIRKGDSE